MFDRVEPLTTFKTPFRFTFRVGPLVFSGDHVVAMCVVPVALLALAWFFSRSDLGIAVRAAADSNERALLLGIPVRRLSRITWVMAASGRVIVLATAKLSSVARMTATTAVMPRPVWIC